jgi:hypothetical protein
MLIPASLSSAQSFEPSPAWFTTVIDNCFFSAIGDLLPQIEDTRNDAGIRIDINQRIVAHIRPDQNIFPAGQLLLT